MSAGEIFNEEDVCLWLDEYKKATNDFSRRKIQNLIAVYFLPLVKRIARGLARRSTDPIEDIIQVGSMGLVKAIQHYNKQISSHLRTYATYFISGEIKHYLRDKASMIKAPREILELSNRMSKLTNEIILELGNAPTDLELATKLNTSVAKVQEAAKIERRKTISLDQNIYNSEDDNLTLFDKIVDEKYYEKQNSYEDKILLKNALNRLPKDLQKAIEMFYFEDLSQRDIAQKIGISQMQVSRNLKKGLNM